MSLRKGRRTAFTLRRGRRSDLDALAALEREIFASHVFAGHVILRANFRRLLASPSATFILAQAAPIQAGPVQAGPIQAGPIQAGAQRLAGYVLVLYRADSGAARIYSIGVAAPFRRRGLAAMLVRAAENDAVARRRKAMRLEVRSDERRIIAFYESFGYQRVGRAPGYYGGRVDALRLEKPLGKEPRQRS